MFIEPELAGNIIPNEIRPGLSLASVTGELEVKDNVYTIKVCIIKMKFNKYIIEKHVSLTTNFVIRALKIDLVENVKRLLVHLHQLRKKFLKKENMSMAIWIHKNSFKSLIKKVFKEPSYNIVQLQPVFI